MTEQAHESVLCRELLASFSQTPPALLVDGTVGLGGHTELFLKAFQELQVIAVDRDPAALEKSRERLQPFGTRVRYAHAAFSSLPQVLSSFGLKTTNAAIFDLGVSSMQLDTPERGFSFRYSGPLDCRMDPTQGISAWELIHELSEKDLADGIYQFGEEHRSRAVARALKTYRAQIGLNDSKAVADYLEQRMSRGRIHPATKTFQALRMMVNRETEEIEALMTVLPNCLNEGGRAAVITFHSGEDRLVKNAFRALKDGGKFRLVYKKAVQPEYEETRRNPRARSAKLRVIERVS